MHERWKEQQEHMLQKNRKIQLKEQTKWNIWLIDSHKEI